MQVGTLVKLKVPCLGNKIGTKGVCYEVYNLGNHNGASVIFENGNYDGFGEDEQEQWLEVIEHSKFKYNFTNVIKLSNDFENGVFTCILSL